MSAIICPIVPTGQVEKVDDAVYEPIKFVYSHLHDRIRTELNELSALSKGLLVTQDEKHITTLLEELHGRYKFMQQVYHYHTTVEDEVVYPELERKVRNVTFGYIVEHEDEERLFEELAIQLTKALSKHGSAREEAVQAFVCKAEQIHTTVGKHLAKEEEQLLPLLLENFRLCDQARLVAHFLACIPLDAAPCVLAWLKRDMAPQVLEQLRKQVAEAVDASLSASARDVLVAWLAEGAVPTAQAALSEGTMTAAEEREIGSSAIDAVIHVHDVIRESLGNLVEEARTLQAAAEGATQPLVGMLESLAERHRLLRQIYLYHCQSEDDVMLPALEEAGAALPREACTQEDHTGHTEALDRTSQMVREALMHARRGTRHARDKVKELCREALAMGEGITAHLGKEEKEVLPVLQRSLGAHDQLMLARRTLCAMPLRLLERVLPWLGAHLSLDSSGRLLRLLSQVVSPGDRALSAVLEAWTEEGRRWRRESGTSTAEGRVSPDTSAGPGSTREGTAPKLGGSPTVELMRRRTSKEVPPDEDDPARAAKRRRVRGPEREQALEEGGGEELQGGGGAAPDAALLARGEGLAPIDHIFQFHEALRLELTRLEDEAMALDGTDEALRRLDGRFQFLWSIYHAHSHAEDAVVFPALEGKEALHSVTKSYAMDHREEEVLFRQANALIQGLLRTLPGTSERREQTAALRRVCAAIHAAVDTHVRAEEEGLWPLFVEHFSWDEQRQLVGIIIGRTGAEVLQAMLPWVQTSLPQDEVESMIFSLKEVAKNTRFDRWLKAVMENGRGEGANGQGRASQEEQRTARGDGDLAKLQEVAEYLQRGAGGRGGRARGTGRGLAPEQPGVVEDTKAFQPGWEDIFRMNQQQLEAAVQRMSKDPELDEKRRAYLIQNLMAARYIVSQQARMRLDASVRSSEPEDPSPGGSGSQGAGGGGAEGAGAAEGGSVASREVDGKTWHAPGVLGCPHYARACQLVAPCCGRIYTCRQCHDDAEDHAMDRYAVERMRCMRCGGEGPVGQDCSHCGGRSARYYCAICHLMDDTPGRDIYHCPFCNVCRRGKGLGVDFFHCMQCNSCMSMSLFKRHRCRENALDSDCPVCHEDLFESSQPVKELPCGHFLHLTCFQDLTRHSYQCPVCKKSVGDMSLYFRMIDAILAQERQRLPDICHGQTQKVLCNDCGKRSEVPFHFVYHKCTSCASYNTTLC